MACESVFVALQSSFWQKFSTFLFSDPLGSWATLLFLPHYDVIPCIHNWTDNGKMIYICQIECERSQIEKGWGFDWQAHRFQQWEFCIVWVHDCTFCVVLQPPRSLNSFRYCSQSDMAAHFTHLYAETFAAYVLLSFYILKYTVIVCLIIAGWFNYLFCDI